ncbi:MAG: hypothetical protein H6706_17715 [Myxococcales bacterium]|nr:hypothetical protein [Myxococcales bacterium]
MMTGRSWWLLGMLALAGCDDGDAGGAGCTPGQSSACACVGGGMGAQVCQADNTFAACICAVGDAGLASDTGPRADQGPQADAAPARDAAPMADAAPMIDAAPMGDAAVAADAGAMADAALPGHTYVAGLIGGATSNWGDLPNAQGLMGLEAGHAACRFQGADHVCDYEELVAAEAAGELADIPAGTTAWLQRTTSVILLGFDSPPGQGGNCVDWTFTGNHLADGEYVSFEQAGIPAWHFDHDTYFDGVDQTRTIPGDLECGGVTRSIFCCYPSP